MAAGYQTKVYIVQKATGEVLAAKTSFGPAHTLAKIHAPARVLFAVADKGLGLNVMEHEADQPECNQLQSSLPSVR